MHNVANGSNIAFLSCYLQVGYLRLELQGCSPLASQQLLITTWKIFPHWNLASCQSCKFCSACTHACMHALMLYPPQAHKHPISSSQMQTFHHHSHHGRPSCHLDRCGRPDPFPGSTWNTAGPWDAFMFVSSPHNFSSLRLFRGGFFRGYVGRIS